jgi:hypothetical protein
VPHRRDRTGEPNSGSQRVLLSRVPSSTHTELYRPATIDRVVEHVLGHMVEHEGVVEDFAAGSNLTPAGSPF